MSDAAGPIVYLVDDDPAVLKALARLLHTAGWETAAFPSAEAFLVHLGAGSPRPGVLVLDVGLPGLDGLDLQRALGARVETLPIVFVTGRGSIPISVQAMKAGAVDFLTKPVSGQTLIAAVSDAVARAAVATAARVERLAADEEVLEFERRVARLTHRERQVLAAVVAGRLNKQIAGDLGIVEQTVKFHRSRVMERMQAHTAAELMHMAARLGIAPAMPSESPWSKV
jgi:FixJ family two-component response regulator